MYVTPYLLYFGSLAYINLPVIGTSKPLLNSIYSFVITPQTPPLNTPIPDNLVFQIYTKFFNLLPHSVTYISFKKRVITRILTTKSFRFYKNLTIKKNFTKSSYLFYKKSRRFFNKVVFNKVVFNLPSPLNQTHFQTFNSRNVLRTGMVINAPVLVPSLYGIVGNEFVNLTSPFINLKLLNKFFLQDTYSNLLRLAKFKFKPINENYAPSYVVDVVLSYSEYFLNTKVLFIISLNFYKYLSTAELFFLRSFYSKLTLYSYRFSTTFFLKEFLDVMFFTIKLHDFSILITYIQRLISDLTIWNHKSFFKFIFNVFREHFTPIFNFLGILGLKIIIKGKVGVTGNSRKRSMVVNLGLTTISNTYSTVNYSNKILNTNTGVLGINFLLISK